MRQRQLGLLRDAIAESDGTVDIRPYSNTGKVPMNKLRLNGH